MNSSKRDPDRFKPYHEPLIATIRRTGAIAVVLATIATVVQLRHLPMSPADWYGWFVLVVFAGWISFGGHWVEVAYLNVIRPRIAYWSDISLIFVRIIAWLIGGALLFVGAVWSRSLLMTGALPGHLHILSMLFYGGLLFVVVELMPHTVFLLSGRPSFWNRRG